MSEDEEDEDVDLDEGFIDLERVPSVDEKIEVRAI